jgi:hypothetical protein
MALSRPALGAVVFLAAAATLAGAVPAMADSGSTAERTAAVVEAATGTGDIAATGTAAPTKSDALVKVRAADGSAIAFGLPATEAVTGTAAGSGTTVYPGAAPSTDLAVQSTTGGGVRALTVLKDASASREQRYDLSLPKGARLITLDSGAIAVVNAKNEVLGGFDAPWAKDANGKSVPTSYRIEGNAIVQTVTISKDTAFPVIADPSWWDRIKNGIRKSGQYAGAGAIGGCVTGALGGVVGCGGGAVTGALSGSVLGFIDGVRH